MKKSPVNSLEACLADELKLNPEIGIISLLGQRMLLMHQFSVAELRRELTERLGFEMARGVFTRLGYRQGLEDSIKVKEHFEPSLAESFKLGPMLRDLEGYVKNTPLEVSFSEENGGFFGDFTWRNSWEAEAHLQHFGAGGIPVCWMNVGYATAFATNAFGKTILAREVECVAMGHEHCRAILKPLDCWSDVEDDLRFLQIEDFVDPPVKRKRTTDGSGAVLGFEENSARTGELIGASAAFNSAVYLLKRVGQTDSTVLFLGESGVGKERFSRALHKVGARADGPFVSVNCAAIPNDLVEAELFGVHKGAYTGATESRAGRFERAHMGTLFLDEIGSLPMSAQSKLLRAIQEREVERVGGKETLSFDVRIVAATNEDLRQAVKEGRFRADLFYRLNVFPIEIPPLRHRREDIPLMLSVFVERYSTQFGKPIRGITRAAMNALRSYDWPGNVRELENMVERAVILADAEGFLDVPHLFSGGEEVDLSLFKADLAVDTKLEEGPGNSTQINSQGAIESLLNSGATLEEIEEQVILSAVERHDGKLASAARELGMGRGQMQYRYSKLRAKSE